MTCGCTPSQTVGPYLSLVLPWPDGSDVVAPSVSALIIRGRVLDGGGDPVPDGLVEVWQADPDGHFDSPLDPRGAARFPGFRGFGRCPTDATGEFAFRTLKPGALPGGADVGGTADGVGGGHAVEAPHLDVSVFARGLLDRVITRLYFPDEVAANGRDPVLSALPEDERRRLVAQPQPDGSLRIDNRLQGAGETPFFQL